MFSLRHFTFSPPWPRCGKWKIYKFLPIRSAINLSLSPPPFSFFFSPGPPRSVFTCIPQYCTTAAAVVALSNGLCLLQNPAGAAVASAFHTAKRSLGALIHPPTHTHERFSQYSAGWCALLPSVFVGPNRSIDSCPGWNTTLETAAARWMFRLGAKLQMLRHSFFFFLACAAKKKKEK